MRNTGKKLEQYPEDWTFFHGRELFSNRKAKGEPNLEVLSVTINSGLVPRSSLDRRMAPDVSPEKSLLVEKGDLVYNMMRMWQGALGISDQRGVVSPAYIVIRGNDKAFPQFMFYLLKSKYYLHLSRSYSFGVTDDRLRLYFKDFKLLPFKIPSLSEQTSISNVLLTNDKLIGNLSELIHLKEKCKKFWMQQLLSGKRRLKGFGEEWHELKLGEVFSERNERGDNNSRLLSITSEKGVIRQSDSNKKDSSNEDKSKYKRIRKYDIGYNTMRMWQGRSALSLLDGIVSPAYTIVTPKKSVDVVFFSYLFKLPKVVHSFYRNSQGLVDDTLNCKFHDFSAVKVYVPKSKAEQTAIGYVLQTSDLEIQLLRRKVKKLRDQKKALMQVLLTGKKRLINK